MRKYMLALIALGLSVSSCLASDCECGYRYQKKVLRNNKKVQNKVIDRQIRGKLNAIEKISAISPCTSERNQEKIYLYQEAIKDLTNQKIAIKRNYKTELKCLKLNK